MKKRSLGKYLFFTSLCVGTVCSTAIACVKTQAITTNANFTNTAAENTDITFQKHFYQELSLGQVGNPSSPYSFDFTNKVNPNWTGDVPGIGSPSSQSGTVNLYSIGISCDIDDIAMDQTPVNTSSNDSSNVGSRMTSLSALADSGLINNLSLHIPNGTGKGISLTTSNGGNFTILLSETTLPYLPQNINGDISQNQQVANPISQGDGVLKVNDNFSISIPPEYCAGSAQDTYFGIALENVFSSIQAHIETFTDGGVSYKKLVIDANNGEVWSDNQFKIKPILMRPSNGFGYLDVALSDNPDGKITDLVFTPSAVGLTSPSVYSLSNQVNGKVFFDPKYLIALDGNYSYYDVETTSANDRNNAFFRLNYEYINAVLMAYDITKNQFPGENGDNWKDSSALYQSYLQMPTARLNIFINALASGKLLNFETSKVLDSSSTTHRFSIPYATYFDTSSSNMTWDEKYFFEDYQYYSQCSLLNFINLHRSETNETVQSIIDAMPVQKWYSDALSFNLPTPTVSGTWNNVETDLIQAFKFILFSARKDLTGADYPIDNPYYRYNYNPTFNITYQNSLYSTSQTLPATEISLFQLLNGVKAEYNDIVNSSFLSNVAYLGNKDAPQNPYTPGSSANFTFANAFDGTDSYFAVNTGKITGTTPTDPSSMTYSPFISAYYDNASTLSLYNFANVSSGQSKLWNRADGAYVFTNLLIGSKNIIDQSYHNNSDIFLPASQIYEYTNPSNPTLLNAVQYQAMTDFFHSLDPSTFKDIWNDNCYSASNKRFYQIYINETTSFKIKLSWDLFISTVPYFQKIKNYYISEPYSSSGSSYKTLTDARIIPNVTQTASGGTIFGDTTSSAGIDIQPFIFVDGYNISTNPVGSTIDDFSFKSLGELVAVPTYVTPQINFTTTAEKLLDPDFFIDTCIFFKGENVVDHQYASVYFSSITRSQFVKMFDSSWLNLNAIINDDGSQSVKGSIKFPKALNSSYPTPYYDVNQSMFWSNSNFNITNFPPPYVPPTPPPSPIIASGLTTPALIGIAVGCIVVGIVAFEMVHAHIRKRKMMREDEEDDAVKKMDSVTGNGKEEKKVDLELA